MTNPDAISKNVFPLNALRCSCKNLKLNSQLNPSARKRLTAHGSATGCAEECDDD